MTENRLVIGAQTAPDYTFDNEDIREITEAVAVDIVGAELSIDQLTAKVVFDIDAAELFSPVDYDGVLSSDGFLIASNRVYDDIRELPYGTVLHYYHGGELEGKYYTKNVDRIAKEVYQIIAMSAVGLLDSQRHVGGLYTGETFFAVAGEIIGGAVPFSCDDDVARITIYGWLPIASKRENLHQLLFATGAALIKDASGDIRFSFLRDAETSSIPDRRIFLGGDVDYSSPASAVEITEHTFEALGSDQEVTLFDNTDGTGAADNTFVSFQSAPIHDLSATGSLAIVESGVNYAVVTGTGVLTGKTYTHVTRVLTREAENPGEENIVTVSDATLVTAANSENAAKRVLAYYSSKKAVGATVVLNGEKAGQQISFNDPYGEAAAGYLAGMEITVSSNLKAKCSIITDYVPTGQGNNYNQSDLYTGTGTFTVEEDGAQATLIGGGSGGEPGKAGSAGERTGTEVGSMPTIGEGGDGGEGGKKGTGGKILTITLPAGTYTYICGVGGSSGNGGGDTEIYKDGVLLYSTADGATSETGVVDLFTGEIYALPGNSDGVAGAKGGKPSWNGSGYNAGNVTFEGQTWTGGANGTSTSSGGYTYYGGGGSGAVVGSNGNTPASGATTGANGVTPAGRAATVQYGCGGDGGHGGSGGGGGGMRQDPADSTGWVWFIGGNGGAGGGAGVGGRGGDGCILVYS